MVEGESVARFEYAPNFISAGVEPSPIVMPVSKRIYSFPQLSRTFHGLPGLFADSLPDKFGNKVIDSWLLRQGRNTESFTALERLCYTGNRGMGALEFLPLQGPDSTESESLDVENLRTFAAEILNQRKRFSTKSLSKKHQKSFEEILRVGTSAGGARAKILVAYNEKTGEMRSGQVAAAPDFGYWLLKLDDVENNSDKESADMFGYGAIEYTYSQMVKLAGIDMTECRLYECSGHRHFMTRRFDCLDGGKKLHYQSLCGLAHYDFNMPGAYSYEQALDVVKRLGLGYETLEQMYRRAVFNICARNQDDHAKNIGFLMDKRGVWTLAPAFDMTYAYNPEGAWTGSHQMTFNGKRGGFKINYLKAYPKFAGNKKGRYIKIMPYYLEAVRQWPKLAKQNGVQARIVRAIEKMQEFVK